MPGMPKRPPKRAPPPEKVKRDAFLYLEPRTLGQQKDFAQCVSCRMWVPGTDDGDRCVVHGSRVQVDADDSCGLYAPWPTAGGEPVEEVVKTHRREMNKGIEASVTPLESGLVDRLVQCGRCVFARDRATRCDLFTDLNKQMPNKFALNDQIRPNACCNAQTPIPTVT